MSLLDIARLGIQIDARQVRDGDRALNDFSRSGERAEGSASKASAAMRRMAAAAATLASALALAKAVQLADEMALMDSRLKLATKSMQEFAQAQRDVYDIAQKNAVSIASVTNLYTKLADPIRAVGGGMKEIKGIVDAFSMSLKISGASTEESASAITQFAQAMGAGKLSGDEFQSMAEASPRFMKALAEGMGVPIGQLKAMGGEGKLTADIVGNALIKALDKLNAEAKQMPETVGGAFTRMKNDIAVSLRDINELKITGGLAGMVDEARKLIPAIKTELVAAFAAVGVWLEANRAKMAEVWEVAKDLIADVWELGKAAAAVVGFLVQWAYQSGLVKTVLETLRFMVAGLQDGVLLIGAGFAKIGSVIMQSVLAPMNTMGELAASIVEVFDPARAAALRASMKAANDFAGAGGKYFDEVMDRFARGDTAVGRLDRQMSGVKLTAQAAAAAAGKVGDAFTNLKAPKTVDPKAAAAAAKELEKQADLMAKLSGLAPDFNEQWDRLTKIYKSGKLDMDGLVKAQAELLSQQPAMVANAKAEADEREAIAAATAGFIDPMYERIEAMREEVARNEELAEQVGMTAVQVERLEIARLRDTLAQAASKELTEKEIFDLQTLITLRERNAAAMTTMGVGVTTEPQKLLDIMEALDEATKSAAQGMADAFGSVGSAIGDLTTALSGYQRTQAAIGAQLAETIKGAGGDELKIAKARGDAARQSAQAQLKSYGDMAKAAKVFFKENSAGYRAMEGAEKAYRAFEMALAVKTMLEKSGLIQAFTGLFVASKATETAATVASVAPDVAASQVKGQAAAAAGVAGQASGDPYTAWGRMAAMAAVMAALGFAVSGGSKPDTTAKDRQAAQGTGTVLGNSSAKSQSIARAIELSAANSNIELNYTAGMLRALLSIESAMSGLSTILTRNGDVGGALPADTTGTMGKLGSLIGSPLKFLPGGEALGKLYTKLTNGIFGGNVTTLDGGLTASATTIGAARAGQFNAQSYVDTKKDGGLFRSDKYSTALTNLSNETNQQFALVIANMADSVGEAAKLLGVGGDAFNQWLDGFTVNLGKISTKGLTGEEIQAALEAQFSMIGDSLASQAVQGLAQFQQVGEGYLETLVRVATNYANLDAILAATGDTFGATGLSSIAARENLIELAGGIDELASKTASFAENFLTEAERLAPVQKYVTDQLAAMGLAGLDTRDKFKQYLLALDLTNPAMQAQYVALMDLQAAFAKTHAATVDLSKSEQEIADERADLQSQLDDLLLSTAEKAAKARAALDPLNRTLFDQVELAQAATDAHEAAKSSLQSLSDEYRNFAKGLEAFGLSLVTGSLSTLNIAGQEAAARAQYEKTAAAALAGDKGALDDIEKVASQFQTISQKANGGDSKYMSDYANVLAMTDKLASYATDRADLAMMQLDAAERSAKGIEELIAILRGSEATLASLATRAPDMPLTAVDNGNALRDEMRALADRIEASSAAAVTSAEKMAALQAQENARVTLAGAEVVANAVTSTAKTRASATNTAAAMDA